MFNVSSTFDKESCQKFIDENGELRPSGRNLLPGPKNEIWQRCKTILSTSTTEMPSTKQINFGVPSKTPSPLIAKKDRKIIIDHCFFEKTTEFPCRQDILLKKMNRGTDTPNLLCYNGDTSIFDLESSNTLSVDKSFSLQQNQIKTEFISHIEKQIFKRSALSNGLLFIRDCIEQRLIKSIQIFCSSALDSYSQREKRSLEETLQQIKHDNVNHGVLPHASTSLRSPSFFKLKPREITHWGHPVTPHPINNTAAILQLN